jgi:SAM-dependent methyltransferase
MDYHKKIDEILFESFHGDRLFRDGLKPYEIDKYRFVRAIQLLEYPKDKIIAEIGPYQGTGIYYFGEHNKITGFGKSSSKFTHIVEQCGHSMVDIDFEFDNIPEQYCNFADIVLCTEVIEHIRHPKQFLHNIVNVLKERGKILLSTNNASYIGYILKLLVSQSIMDGIETENTFYPGHTRYYHLNEMCKNLEAEGLTVIHKANVNYLPDASYYKNRIFGVLKNMLIRTTSHIYSTHIEIVAYKNESQL